MTQRPRSTYTPLLTPLITLATGIAVQNAIPMPWWILATGCMVTTATLFGALCYRRMSIIRIICALFAGLVGALLLTLQRAEHAGSIAHLAHQKITVTATIIDKDHWGPWLADDVLRLKTITITTPTATITQSCELLCYMKRHTFCRVGDQIRIENIMFKPPPEQSSSGNPAYYDYLIKEHIVGSLFIPFRSAVQCIYRPSVSLRRWLWNFRLTTYRALTDCLTPLTRSYVGLIFLGNKQQLEIDDLRQKFNYWGLSHYLARSGIHIILIIMIWRFLLGFIPLYITFKRLFLIILCLIYDIVSWSSIPFTRAYYAFLITEGGGLCGRHTNSLHLLTLMCLTILLYNPMQLFFLDFQLTFGLTFTLLLLSRLLNDHQQGKIAKTN